MSPENGMIIPVLPTFSRIPGVSHPALWFQQPNKRQAAAGEALVLTKPEASGPAPCLDRGS
jgi:hypothetical protein